MKICPGLRVVLSATVSICFLSAVKGQGVTSAWEVHGAASISALRSDQYAFQEGGMDDIEFSPIEFTINASRSIGDFNTIGGQIYAYHISGFEEVTVDWLQFQHSFSEAFALRLGRYRFPGGYFQESQDVDEAHVFALLPDHNYRKIQRANRSNLDGAQLFGLIDWNRNGRLEYKLFIGAGSNVKGDSAYLYDLSSRTFLDIHEIDLGLVKGLQFEYHTPIQGLSVHASYSVLPDTKLFGNLYDRASTERIAGPLSFLPRSIDSESGAGTWNRDFAGSSVEIASNSEIRFLAINYENQSFSLNLEWRNSDAVSDVSAKLPAIQGQTTSDDLGWAAMGSYRISDRWEAGVYYEEYYPNRSDRHGTAYTSVGQDAALAWQKQWVAALRHNVGEHFIIKLEYHLVDGLARISRIKGENGDFRSWDPNWDYYVLKTTWTF